MQLIKKKLCLITMQFRLRHSKFQLPKTKVLWNIQEIVETIY